MKYTKFNCIALLMLSIVPAKSQNLSGSSLTIGSQNQFSGSCFSVGHANNLRIPLDFGYFLYAARSGAIGMYNESTTEDSLVVGRFNGTDYLEQYDGTANCSGVFGEYNYLAGDKSLMVGTTNSIARQFVDDSGSSTDWVKPKNAVVMGTGLINRFDNCTILGKNNVSVSPTSPHTGPSPLFIVANGSSSANRSNAFEIHDNGDIIISKPQGDISMGIYGE